MVNTAERRQPLSHFLAGAMVTALLTMLVLSPSALTLYLYQQGGTQQVVVAPDFHVIAILIAVGFSGFVSLMTLRSYQRTGKAFERWLLLGMVGFTVIYAPHGLLTNHAHDNVWLFILYGPSSRLVMSACFFAAVLQYGKLAPIPKKPQIIGTIAGWGLFYLAVLAGTAYLATSPIAGERYVRWSLEILAIGFELGALVLLAVRKLSNSMMMTFGVTLVLFAQSGVAFLYAPVWSHSWWYAHIIFAAGFGLLSYQVALIYRFTGSFEDIFSQEELLVKLRVANENYQRSNRELSNFAHMVSHDLQAPLRRMSSFIDLLLEELEPEKVKKLDDYVSIIQKNSEQMRALITSILELSEVNQSKLELKKVDLNVLVGEVLDLFSKDLRDLGATCTVDHLPTVSGDATLLFQVFQNLVQNAIKYRNRQRDLRIEIRAAADGDFWRIDVKDNGMGFDMKLKDTVFKMLGRLHGEDISGTGAGLAICTKILERHGGQIDAVATPDQGATFQVYLPRSSHP